MAEFKPPSRPVEIRADELTHGDELRDKSGNIWLVSLVAKGDDDVSFMLADRISRVPVHSIHKKHGDLVTVLREDAPPAWATEDPTVGRLSTSPEDEAKLQAAHPKPLTMEDAVTTVTAEFPEATVDVQVSADQQAEADGDGPITVPAVEDMTPLELRSHLYLLHGVLGDDGQSVKQLRDLHFAAHRDHAAGKLQSRHRDHAHSAPVEVKK